MISMAGRFGSCSRTFFLALVFVVFKPCVFSKDLTWAPQFDQNAQFHVDICHADPANGACTGNTYLNHPDFLEDLCDGLPRVECENTQTRIIENGIAASYAKGIRYIDIYFYLAQGNFDISNLCNNNPNCVHYMNARIRNGQLWIDAVERFNARINSDYFKIKIRVPAFGIMSEVAHNKRDNSYEELQNIKTSIQECSGSNNSHLIDLANPKIRNYVGIFTKQALIGARSRLTSGKTKIEEVTLALDGAGESCLWGNEKGPASCTSQIPFSSFSNKRYPAGASFHVRAAYFRDRERFLKETYKIFADAAYAVDPLIKPAIFMQTWTMDGRIRGTFDLYDLLKGTGIKILHHDDFVNIPGEYLSLIHHKEHTAEAATITKALGISFDEELSWAHVQPAGTEANLAWWGANPPDIYNMIPQNAQSFYRQVQASFLLGGTGFTYANWATQSIIAPPMETKCFGISRPTCNTFSNPDWSLVIGDRFGHSPDHLIGASGLLTRSLTTELPSASKAIYLSAFGRMECEEAQTCASHAYIWNVFAALGLEAEFGSRKVDVITDGMIRDGAVDLDSYSAIYLPYLTSGVVDTRVLNKLKARASNANIIWENAPGSLTGFSNWKSSVRSMVVSAIVPSTTRLLLLE